MWVSQCTVATNGLITNFAEPVGKEIKNITYARATQAPNYARANKFLAEKYNEGFGINVPMPM